MSRLVVVSNRVAIVNERKQSAGGLAVALAEALREDGGIWFGWSGQVSQTHEGGPSLVVSGSITYATVDLDQRDIDEYYNGFANSTLWPLFHFRLGLTTFSRRNYEGYQRVNEYFADQLIKLLRPDDRVWIHDYHLIPLAEALRRRGARQRIGYFLHIPFPAPEILVALPNHRELVHALCAYDVVGFQTERDVRCFVNYALFEAGGAVEHMSEDGIRLDALDGRPLVRAFPIAADTIPLRDEARAATKLRTTERLVRSLMGRRLIIGCDRLDYSKGLPQRLEAFRLLLENHPEHVGKVSFLQIAPPSRTDVPEYQAIRRELESMAGAINGRYAEFDWQPIRYLNSSFGRRTLAGFFRTADIGLVTPLRDGMNLVAKEYAICQDEGDPGVLVLSRFAGAADELKSAMIVNPFDVEEVAEALHRALEMPLEERIRRHADMMRVLTSNDIGNWRRACVKALSDAPRPETELSPPPGAGR